MGIVTIIADEKNAWIGILFWKHLKEQQQYFGTFKHLAWQTAKSTAFYIMQGDLTWCFHKGHVLQVYTELFLIYCLQSTEYFYAISQFLSISIIILLEALSL